MPSRTSSRPADVVRAIPATRRGGAAALVLRQAQRMGAQRGAAGARLHRLVEGEAGGARARSPSSSAPERAGADPRQAWALAPAMRCSSSPASRGAAVKFAGAARTRIGEELEPRRQGALRALLDRRFPDVRVERGGEEDRLLPQSVLDAEHGGRRVPGARPGGPRENPRPSRRSSTTSSATASSCPPAPSATTAPT